MDVIKISSEAELRKKEPEILERLKNTYKGESRFLIDPLRTLKEVQVELDPLIRKRLIKANPLWGGTSRRAYEAVMEKSSSLPVQFSLHELFPEI